MLQRPATAGASIDKIDNLHRNIWASALGLDRLSYALQYLNRLESNQTDAPHCQQFFEHWHAGVQLASL